MGVICPNEDVLVKDPKFQALKEAYKDKHFSDKHLANALVLFRQSDSEKYSDDWYPETLADKDAFTRFINQYLTAKKISKTDSELTQDKVYDLYTTLYSIYSPEKLSARINMISSNFRSFVDQLEKNDTTNRSRLELIKAQADDKRNGFAVILSKIFSMYERFTDVEKMMEGYEKKFPNATETQKAQARTVFEYRANEYKKLLDNKERLAALVAVSVGENEGFMVRVRDFEINFDPYDKDAAISEERNNATTKEGDAEEGSKGDRYVDFRTLDLMSTLSPRTRRLINKIPKVDTDMNILRDDLGMTQYISGRQVAVVLNKVLVNSSPDTLISDLTDAADYYPWINGLIKVLNVNTDYRTDIYDNFKKAESVYLYTDLEDGSYTVKMSNSRSQGKVLMREAGDNMQSGYVQDEKTSIYVGYGSLVSKDKLAKIRGEYDELSKFLLSNEGVRLIKMVDQDKPYSQKYIDNAIAEAAKNGKDISYLKLPSDEAMKTFLEKNPDVAKKIASLLRGMGFNVREKDIKAIALQTMTTKSFSFVAGWEHKDDNVGRNKLYQLVRWMGGVYDRADYILKNSKANEQTGQHLYNTAAVELGHINNTLALSQYQEVEPRVVVEGSSYSAYNNINLIHQTFDFLANKDHRSEEKYLDDLNNEYLQFEGMAIGKGKSMQVYGWLRRLLENSDNIREKMRVYDMTTFDHKDYAGLTLKQKLTNSLLAFFAERVIASEGYALYEAPISGDYDTAYNFISAPKLSDDELVDEFTNELLLELDRISLIQERLKDDNRVKLSVYEKQGLKIQTFPELNNTEFIETYRSFEDSKEAIDFVRSQVKEQLDNVVKRDIAKLEKEKVFTNKFLKKVNLGYGHFGSFYSAENKFEDLKDDAKDALVNASKNIYYARKQISKLLAGGTEQFNGLGDYEKRNMLSHATRTAMNTNATWNGKRVGKETQNVVYIEDDTAQSAFLEDYIKPMSKDLKDAGVISGRQYEDMIKAYSNITTTDGQGLRTLESYRAVRAMASTWDQRHEDAYQRIIRGIPTKGDIDVFMEGIKPVYTGHEVIPAAAGERQKPVKLTVLHKYSEMVLLPEALSRYCLQTKSVPMQALEEARKQLKSKGKDIDMFLFHSGVKVGAHSILQPFAKDESGKRILNTKDEIASNIISEVLIKTSTVHTLPFKYYGIAASTPAHVANDKIAWATQAEKVALANISEEEKSTLRGEETFSTDLRDRFYEIKTAEIVTAYKQLVDTFSNSDELERIFREELATKPYSSYEMQYALAHLKDGTFALPLFSPNIAHEVQQLLASVIKKRITKPIAKGANILQSTGLGMDIDASLFDNSNALTEDEKLSIVFEGEGKNMRIKYVDVFIPIHDSRLERFKDETGGIKPETLRKLVADKVIPEEILNFIAYRTPSDAEHSVIPCRVKGFVANTGGATITMPKEIMVMTGHDYDGDKMRCHFADFEMGLNDEKIRELYDRYQNRPEYSKDIVKAILGDDAALNQIESYESFSKMVKSKNNPSVEAYKKINYIAYDYNKSALENSEKARANAKVELIFAKLTSPDGSRRMLIPGGCNDTKVIAKSLNIVRFAKDDKSKAKVADAIISREVKKILDKNPNMSEKEALSRVDVNKISSIVRNTNSLYESLIRKSDSDLTAIMREISSSESPFSLSHSVEAFDYIMGGAELIAIYAMYNSALQMMQRLDMSYVPSVSQFDNSPYTVSILGTTFGKLFNVKNHKGRLASLGLARLLNAAVDNTKDPVLGYLNQSKEMMGFTFLMFAAGMTEEEIHLFMNQPAIIELTSRLKGQDSENISTEINNLVAEISKDKQFIDKRAGSQYKSLQNVAKMDREDYISHLADSFDDLKTSVDEDFLVQQVSLLQTLAHLNPAASNLETFVKCTRPDSRSGAIGTTLASIVVKKGDLDKFREKLNKSTVEQLHIKGMNEVMKKVDVHDGWDLSYLEDVLDSPLPEVTAMNNLMIDSSLKLFSPYFPQANKSWVELNTLLTNTYKYTGNQREVISRKIGQEMILWKLLSDKKFITGDPQEEQRRIIIDVPKQLKDLKQRIASAKNDPNSKDETANKLVGNLFLQKLRTTSPENSTTAPRIQFSMNGPALHGQADTIRSHWNALLMSDDKKVVQLAKDLFKYNLYTNGFSYGMYEFFHMTPFSVLLSTENYISALRNVLKSDWSNDSDRDNFINQYYRNHWGDSKFLNVYPISNFGKVKFESRDGVRIGKDDIAESLYNQIKTQRYIIISSGEGNKTQTLYQVYASPERNEIFLSVATKIGSRNRNQQVTLQYNPTVIYTDVKPVVPGNDSAWGNLDVEPVYTASNYMAAGQRESALQYLSDNDFAAQLAANAFGLSTAKANLEQAEKKADVTSKKNDNILPNLEKSAVLPTSAQVGAFGLGQANPEALKAAVVNVSSEDSDKKLYNILPLTDEERDIKEKAVSSGTFMKAPNGEPTNLTEKQWLQVRTKAFKNWFGDWENDPKNASKVVDENGEPKVVYHGTLAEFSEFDIKKLGNTTGKGSYTDKITGETVEIDSNNAFFFTDNINAAYSYRNLAIWQQNDIKRMTLENLYSFINSGHIYHKIENEEDIKFYRSYIDNILSPIVGYDIRNAVNKKLLNNSQKKELLGKIREWQRKVNSYTDARAISNMRNNHDSDIENLNYLKKHKEDILNKKELPYFKRKDMLFIGYDENDKEKIYISISSEGNKETLKAVFNDGKGLQEITKDNIDKLFSLIEEALQLQEERIQTEETEAGYNNGYIMPVFLNINNPLSHNYEGSAFPDKYKPNEKYGTGYIAARQVRRALKDGKDGVIYENVRDPFEMTSYGVFNPNQIKSATDNSGEFSTENNDIYLSILEKDEKGNYVEQKVPATPQNIREARRQKAFVELNKKLREILRQKGVGIGVLTDAEARMSLGGIAAFDTANVTAEGLKELIRLAKGIAGEYALPEEFAHLALEMLGHEHPLVKRLLNALDSNDEALKEAFGDQYGEYNERYKKNREKMVVEAAGKLLAKNMLREEELSTSKIRRIFARVIDAIKSLLRKFSINEINNAIFDANNISSKIARDLLGGKIIDNMSLENISSTTQYYNVKKDLTDKEDILSKLLKTEVKRLSILQKRNAYGDKDKKPKSIIATEAQIKKLEVSIKNYKTEDAVVTYMRDSVEFLAATQESLKKAVESGRPANWVCGKLNTVRDTLYSFSSSLEDIRQAIIDGEIQDNIGIHESMEKISGVLNILFTEYNKYARLYFEDMLSNIYGEHGKTVTIGKDKGRIITIHEMATKADRDISLASRWFNSLADCNDYALRAIDDLTREAKMKAREKARKIKARIEVAIADLIRETGSRNQDFMFQYELGKDGKMHKTGYYITEEQSKKLTPAKKKFYDTMMDIKNDADRNLPETLLDEGKIVMLRKYTMDRFKDAEGAKGKALEAWEGLKNRVLEMGDIDYEYYEVVKDFEGNRVDMLPVKFLMKGKDESYDDMTDDVATSIMAYAGMAYEYGELDNIIGILENARYMASQRDVIQKIGTRTQRESIVTDDYAYMKPFTIKQAKTNMQNALDDFFKMHVYGHIRANEGTFGKTRLSKRKVVDAINTITSYSQMALNIPQRLSNVTVGVAQIFIESAGKSEYNAKDVSWASSIYMRHTADRLADTGKTESDDKLSLWNEYFDIHQDNGRNNEKYKKGWLSRIFNTSLLFAGLTIGEDYLASVTALSLAKNFKMKAPDGKITNLWDAYTVKYLDPANKKGAYLALKKGYKKADGTELTVEDERKFQKKVIGMNFELQGIYNLDDRSAIQQYAFGALIIMYRKWIAPAMRRRYGRTGYSSLKDDYQEGYWRTTGRFLWDSISKKNKDQVNEDESKQAIANMLSYGHAILSSIKLNWSKMNAYEKSNCKKAATEFGIIAGLTAALFLNGKMFPPEEERKDRTWWEKQLLVQALRLKTELGSMAPTLAFLDESLKVLKSPFAAIGPLRDALNIFNLMIPMNYFDTVKSGRFKGHTKAYKFFWELPIISMWKKVDNFVDPTPMINYYNNDSIM